MPFHGTGWYRKTFEVPTDAEGKVVSITFDGAMDNAHVWIEYKNPVHVADWGTFLTTPEVDQNHALVSVESTLEGKGQTIRVEYEILEPSGEIVASSTAAASSGAATAKGQLTVKHPKRWELDEPNLYTLRTTLRDGETIVDTVHTRFGIRTLKFSKTEGFFLNGKQTRIQGVCLHHDNGPLGAVVNRRAIQRKLQIMKQMGVNSVRTSHNPPSNELLDLCDELGILVQVEALDVWQKPKVPNGYRYVWVFPRAWASDVTLAIPNTLIAIVCCLRHRCKRGTLRREANDIVNHTYWA